MSQISVKTGKDESARTVTVTYDIPENLGGLTAKYGEDVVFNFAERAITLAVQALVRQKAAAGSDDAALQHAVDTWVPGVRSAGTKKSPLEKAQAALAGMSKDDLAALLAKVKEAAKAA